MNETIKAILTDALIRYDTALAEIDERAVAYTTALQQLNDQRREVMGKRDEVAGALKPKSNDADQ